MLTVPTGSRSSHRPPSDGSPAGAGVGEGDADLLAEADELLEAVGAGEELPPPPGPAAWVQPASSSAAAASPPANATTPGADLSATPTTVTAGQHQAREANLPGLVCGAMGR